MSNRSIWSLVVEISHTFVENVDNNCSWYCRLRLLNVGILNLPVDNENVVNVLFFSTLVGAPTKVEKKRTLPFSRLLKLNNPDPKNND